MSLPSPVKGPMTKLPEGTYGNFPEKTEVKELFEDEERFIPPAILTRTQLLEQLGPELLSHDPLWFLYDVRKLPCLSNIGLMAATSGILFSGLSHYLFKAKQKTILKVAGTSSAIGIIVGTAACLKQHASYNEYLMTNRQYRTRNSYGLPEVIQRERDATIAQAYSEHDGNNDVPPVIPANSSSIASIFPLPPPPSSSSSSSSSSSR